MTTESKSVYHLLCDDRRQEGDAEASEAARGVEGDEEEDEGCDEAATARECDAQRKHRAPTDAANRITRLTRPTGARSRERARVTGNNGRRQH